MTVSIAEFREPFEGGGFDGRFNCFHRNMLDGDGAWEAKLIGAEEGGKDGDLGGVISITLYK